MKQFFLICFYITLYSLSVIGQVSERMSLLSNWKGSGVSRYNDCWGYVDGRGNEYAIIGSATKIHFVDISDPRRPTLVNEFRGGASSPWRDIKTYSCYAYSVADVGSEGLMVFDLSELPEGNVTKVYQKNVDFRKAHNIFVDASVGRLYIIGSDSRRNGLIIYDLKDNPAEPKLLASVRMPGDYSHDAFIKDNIAYCSHETRGLYIYDISNPRAPRYKASIATGGYNHSSWPTEDEKYLIYAEEVPKGKPLRMIDISKVEDDDLEIVSTFSAPLGSTVTYHNPYILDHYVIISSYEDGVTIYDIEDPSNPRRVAYYDTYPRSGTKEYNGCWGVYPYFPSGIIIGSDISSGLFVLSTDITLTTDCNNGRLDDFEEEVDRGGFCKSGCGGVSPCLDFDKDGYTSEMDCDDANPLVPAEPGTSCNDGNPDTKDDVIQADGCSCAGI